jgi:hypothetical protein
MTTGSLKSGTEEKMSWMYLRASSFVGKRLAWPFGFLPNLITLPFVYTAILVWYIPFLVLIPADSLLSWKSPRQITNEINEQIEVP